MEMQNKSLEIQDERPGRQLTGSTDICALPADFRQGLRRRRQPEER